MMRTKLVTPLLFSALSCLGGCIEKPAPGDGVADATETGLVETSTTDEGNNFVPDMPIESQCDPWAQDCPEGEKCVPYSENGGPWHRNKCVPVLGEGQPGDSCTYDGITSATDSCGAGSHCWDVQEVEGELIGVCTSFCEGNPDNPICGPDTSCLMANEGSINLCVATCDPLLQACDENLACYWSNNDFNCIFTTDNIGEGESCGFINDCVAGNFCALSEVLPDCDGGSCCTAYCDLVDPVCNVEGTECASFFDEGLAAPGYEDVGVCIMPG